MEKQNGNKEKKEANAVLKGLRRAGEAAAVVAGMTGLSAGIGALALGTYFAKIGAVVKPIVSGLTVGNVVDGGVHGFTMGATVGAEGGAIVGIIAGSALGIWVLKGEKRK